MMSPTPADIVNAYIDAIARREYAEARTLLADADFEYISPMHRFTSADDLVAYMHLALPILQRLHVRKVFCDGDELCHIIGIVAQISEKRSSTVMQWSKVADGKIRRLELVFDAYEYKKLLE